MEGKGLGTYTVKETPVGADKIIITDSEDSNKTKEILISTLGVGLMPATESDIQTGTENTKYTTSLRWLQGFAYHVINYVHSGFNTTVKTIQGAINEIVELLDLKAMQNVGICAKRPIYPEDIVIDSDNLTLTIATINGGQAISASNIIRFFTDGGGEIVKHDKTTAQEVSFTKTTGIWYFHFDSDGDLIATQSQWTDFNIIAPVYRFYLNAELTNAEMITVRAFEAHRNDISASDHTWKHAQGTININGFDIVSNPLVTGSPNADGRNTCLSLTQGINSDDGLEYQVKSSTTPTLQFYQDLGMTTAASLTSSNSGLFKVRINDSSGRLSFLPATRYPFAWDTTTNRPEYITALGVRTLVADNRWFVYYVYSLQDDKVGEAIKVVSAETEFTSLLNAQSHNWENLQALYTTLRDNEIRPLYKVIFYNDNSGGGAFSSSCKYSVIREFSDIRKQKITNTAIASGSVLASNVTTQAKTVLLGTNQETVNQEINDIIQGGTVTMSTDDIVFSRINTDFEKTITAAWTPTFSGMFLNAISFLRPKGTYTITLTAPSGYSFAVKENSDSDGYVSGKSTICFRVRKVTTGSDGIIEYFFSNDV